jgi:Fe-S cluster assembly protein SufD
MEKWEMPSRHDEDWRAFCWSRFNLDNYRNIKQVNHRLNDVKKREGFDSLVFLDGVFSSALSDLIEWPSGVKVELSHPFSLWIPHGVQLERPIQLLQITTRGSEGTQTNIQFDIILEESAKAVFWFENWSSEKTTHALIDQKIRIKIGAHAICNMVTCQREQGVQRLVKAEYHQEDSSRLESFYLGLNTDWVREEHVVEIDGEYTVSRMRGLLFPTEKEYMALHTRLKHKKKNTHAEQVFRAVAADNGVAQLQGRVLVEPGADKTHSTQSYKSILLNEGAKARACPQLEIYAHDVVCNHGASIGELEESQLFYLQSRGIDKDKARRMLLHGFSKSVVDEVEEPLLRSELLSILEDYWREVSE